ncbi:MAG: DUF288 domain-containing protein [Flavobacterium sp.]|nr:MAG: DUF288 domain-containing protein [Flavobacterium sp.]
MKSIVITSIFSPTEAVSKFSFLTDYDTIVVGDQKTPSGWKCKNVQFLSIEEQSKLEFNLSKLLPINHYCRKMLGYLQAIQNGAEVIIDTDDDNIPKQGWEFPPFEGTFDNIEHRNGFVNVYRYFTDAHIWPRGLPLSLIRDESMLPLLVEKNSKIGVWQGLADEDPDVDAIYRLTSDKPCYFQDRNPLVLSNSSICPFNSQNTAFRKELFPLLYLPTYVTFRFTDILRGLVAQPIMWSKGYSLGFTRATVVQKRNPHDYFKDFISEIPMYEYTLRVVEIAKHHAKESDSINDNVFNIYTGLFKENIVNEKELVTLEAWLNDITN